MPMVAAPVAGWLVAAGASTTVGAIGGAVVAGALTGAIIGAATAAFTGGSILKGALIGAAVGGITGGIGEAFTGTVAAGINAPAGVGGVNMAGNLDPLTGLPTGNAAVGAAAPSAISGIVAPTAAPVAKAGISDGMLNILGKAAAGIGKSLMAPSAKDKAEAAGLKTAAEIKAEQAANQPGVWDPNILNIRLPEAWQATIDPISAYKKPLEKQGLVRPNAEVMA